LIDNFLVKSLMKIGKKDDCIEEEKKEEESLSDSDCSPVLT